ncbi:metalloproteinase [Glaciecola sp. MH2013]|uniref:imelysin family protein n=1 Tax=Glaciecola sp. MH2013 TaxID=2785524 RepID=UPI0018A015F5|nr:imelysin family protein [Glaciecola sp. MH2013]MBF7072201.1 metalloproteinase [Glaciecola sp. MH2013]
MKKRSLAIAIALTFTLGACVDDGDDGLNGVDGVTGADGAPGQNGVSTFVSRDDVVATNANIAYAAYADSLISVVALRNSLETFIASPTEANFTLAKQAWLASREPYGQTEVYRFRVGPIDALKEDGTMGDDGDGPEGSINAWPLGEAIIDYVAPVVDGNSGPESAENALSGNAIANITDYPVIDKETISSLFEFGEDERNVTTGYHAIEFLLWGQDLNEDLSGAGQRDSSGGQRPVSDFYTTENGNPNACTSGEVAVVEDICARRGDYLLAATDILIDDLTAVVEAWEPGAGVHYNAYIAGGDVSLAKIFEGMGRLSFGELGGERIKIALATDSQEDEHSCFSDNTHRDIFLNAKGVQNSFLGSYTRIDGELIEGASPYDLMVVEGHFELANQLRASLEETMAKAAVIDTKAKTGTPFDQLIQEGVEQENITAVIAALVQQTDDIEQAISALGITTNDLRQDTEEDIGG